MFNAIKKLVVAIFLNKEVAALKTRLAEASAALDKIETTVVGLAKEAPVEAQKLAEEVLKTVLSSADKVRAKESGFVHDWEEKAYAAYNAGKATLESVLAKAEALVSKTKVFFAKHI